MINFAVFLSFGLFLLWKSLGMRLLGQKIKTFLRLFIHSTKLLSNLHQLPAMDALSVSWYLLALPFKKCIANVRGEKLDLVVVLICITLIICECGQFLHICLLTMLLSVETRCLDFLSLSPSLSSRE